jgi:DNA-directed RNA polymerase specialized sigma24 family protein
MREAWQGTGPGPGRPEDPELWRSMMSQLSAEQRQRIQTELQALPPADRAAFRRQRLEAWLQSRANE